jgi:hypothetical protein
MNLDRMKAMMINKIKMRINQNEELAETELAETSIEKQEIANQAREKFSYDETKRY